MGNTKKRPTRKRRERSAHTFSLAPETLKQIREVAARHGVCLSRAVDLLISRAA